MLRNSLEKSKHLSTRRAAILYNESECATHLSLIKHYLAEKYKINGEVTTELLLKAQMNSLYSDIKQKTYHENCIEPCAMIW